MGNLTAFSFSLADQGFCDWLEKHLQSQDLIKAHKSDGSIEVDRNAMIEFVRSGTFSQYELSEPQKRYLYDLAKNGRIFLQASDHDTEAFLSDRVQAFFIAIHRENLGLKEKDSWNLGHRLRSKVLDTGTEEKDLEALFRRFSDPQELQLFIKLIERHPSAEGKSIAQILEAELSSKELGRVWGVLQSKLKSKYDYQALAYQNYTDDLIRLEKINTQAGHKTLAVHHESSQVYAKWQRNLSRRSQELALSEASLKKIQDPRLTLLLLASADALKLDEKVKERLDLYRLDREITDQRGSRKAVESKAEFFEWMREETDSSSFDEKYSKFKQSLGDLLAYLENGVGLEEGQMDALESLLLELHAEQEILLQGEEEGLRGAELGLMGSEEGSKILLGAAVTLWSRGALSSVLGSSFGATTLTSIMVGTGFETASRMEAEYLARGEIKNSSEHFQSSLGNAYKTVTAANIGTGVRLLGNAGAQLSKSKAMGVYASTERIPLHLGVAHVLSKSGTVQRMVSNPLIGVHHSALLGQYENIRGDNLAWWVLNAGGQRLNDKLMNSHMLHRLGEMSLEAGEELGENQLNSYGGNDAYQVAVSMSAGLTEVSGKFNSSSSHLTSHFVQELGAYALTNPRTITSVLLLASAVLPTVIQGELNWTTLSILLPALGMATTNMNDRLSALRGLLHAEPNSEALEAIGFYFLNWPSDLEGRSLAWAYAREHLDSWRGSSKELDTKLDEFIQYGESSIKIVKLKEEIAAEEADLSDGYIEESEAENPNPYFLEWIVDTMFEEDSEATVEFFTRELEIAWQEENLDKCDSLFLLLFSRGVINEKIKEIFFQRAQEGEMNLYLEEFIKQVPHSILVSELFQNGLAKTLSQRSHARDAFELSCFIANLGDFARYRGDMLHRPEGVSEEEFERAQTLYSLFQVSWAGIFESEGDPVYDLNPNDVIALFELVYLGGSVGLQWLWGPMYQFDIVPQERFAIFREQHAIPRDELVQYIISEMQFEENSLVSFLSSLTHDSAHDNDQEFFARQVFAFMNSDPKSDDYLYVIHLLEDLPESAWRNELLSSLRNAWTVDYDLENPQDIQLALRYVSPGGEAFSYNGDEAASLFERLAEAGVYQTEDVSHLETLYQTEDPAHLLPLYLSGTLPFEATEEDVEDFIYSASLSGTYSSDLRDTYIDFAILALSRMRHFDTIDMKHRISRLELETSFMDSFKDRLLDQNGQYKISGYTLELSSAVEEIIEFILHYTAPD